MEASCLGKRFPERSISHLNPDAAKSDAIKTSALLEDLNSLPFGVATLGLFDLYEPELSSILTGLQDLVAHLEAVAETSCQTKGLSTRHQQNNLNKVVILIKDCKRLVYLKFAIMTCGITFTLNCNQVRDTAQYSACTVKSPKHKLV